MTRPGGLRQVIRAVFHQARLPARAAGPAPLRGRNGQGVLPLLDPDQNLAQALVLHNGRMADPLQLVEYPIDQLAAPSSGSPAARLEVVDLNLLPHQLL